MNPSTYVLTPLSDQSIQTVIDQMEAGDVLQLKRGSYHQQVDVSGKQHIRLEAYPGDEGQVFIEGRSSVDWLWTIDPVSGAFVCDYPGLPGLFHWQGDHPLEAFNNRLMYPVLATIGETPLLWQAEGPTALEPGQFYIDSPPESPGKIYVLPLSTQAIRDFLISPFDRLLWGDETCNGISIRGIHFRGCSNTGKTGAINTPGQRWYLENVSVSLVNTIGIEMGQGGTHVDMRSHTRHSTFINVWAYQCGQMGWWGAGDHATLENCGHEGSNWKGFDHWWEASHKFEGCRHCLFIRWTARDCRGPGFWFDIDNAHNTLIAPHVENCVRTGIELELGASDNHIHNLIIHNIRHETIHPDKAWEVAAGLVIKANSNNNIINGGSVSGCIEAIRLDNEDERGISNGNIVMNLQLSNNKREVKVLGKKLENQL